MDRRETRSGFANGIAGNGIREMDVAAIERSAGAACKPCPDHKRTGDAKSA